MQGEVIECRYQSRGKTRWKKSWEQNS